MHGFSGSVLLCLVMIRQKQLISSDVCRDILSVQIQSKLIEKRYRAQMNNDPTHTAKASQEFMKVKSVIFCNGRVCLLILTRLSSVSLAED